MSKILFLSDLHGNMPATLALESEIKRINPDLIYFLGDAIGKGPENDKTCNWIRENCDKHIIGNWDEFLCTEREVDDDFHRFYSEQVGEENMRWLLSLPREDEILISGINFRLFHGRFVDQLYRGHDRRDKLKQGFTSTEGVVHGGFICGDCHMPFVRETREGYVANTGSVGNTIGTPNAHALLVEGDLGCIERKPIYFTVIAVPYDNKLAAKIAREMKALPDNELFAQEVLTGKYSRRKEYNKEI